MLKAESQNIPIENNQKNEKKTLLRPQNEKKKMECISIICWIFQILIWIGGLNFLFLNTYLDDKKTLANCNTGFIIYESICYILYVIFQFCSPTFSYLRHKKSDEQLFNKMKKLFNTPPEIQFICECYHYETRTYTTYDSKGNRSTRTETVRVVTSVNTMFFRYYSSRDVSGLFKLNYDKSKVSDKFYVKLELLSSIDFADSVTYNDWIEQKEKFCDENRHKDIYMDFMQKEIIEGLTTYNLINITENNPCGMSILWYIFFLFIGFAQIYKIYINSKCIYKSFKLRKIISTRYDLSTEECDIKYKKFDPVIDFEDETIQISKDKIANISNDFEQKLPTQEEIENAQKYNDKVFDFSQNKEDKDKECKDDIIILKNKIGTNDEDNNFDNNNYENNYLKAELLNK